MSAYVKTVQERKAETINGVPKFTVSTAVVDRGPLPTSKIFVIRVEEVGNPLLDRLVRVAGIADFEDLVSSREKAISSGTKIYRSGQCIQEFDSVEVAQKTAKLFLDKIDVLAHEWLTYDADFLGVESSTHPRPDPSQLQELAQKYFESRKQLESFREERDALTDEYVSLQAERDIFREQLENLKEIETLVSKSTSALEAFQTYLTNVTNARGDVGSSLGAAFGTGFSPGETLYDALNNVVYHLEEEYYLTAKWHAEKAGQILHQVIEPLYGNAFSQARSVLEYDFPDTTVIEEQVSELDEGLSSLEDKTREAYKRVHKAQTEVEAAQTAEERALTEVLEIFPGFDPSKEE